MQPYLPEENRDQSTRPASVRSPVTLRLGAWTIDTVGGVLESSGRRVRLSPRANQVLGVLLRHPMVTVTRSMLLDEVWRGAEISDEVVTKAVREIRAAFGDDTHEQVVATVPRVGYRLMLAPESIESSATPESASTRQAAADAQPPTVAARPPTRNRSVGFGILILLCAVAGIWPVARQWLQRTWTSEQLTDALTRHARAVAATPARESMPDISPDGRRIAYSARVDAQQPAKIYYGSTDAIERRRLTQDEHAHEFVPTWDATGQRIAYIRLTDKRCAYMVGRLDSADVQRVAPCGSTLVAPEFTHDGAALIVPQIAAEGDAETQIWVRVNLATGEHQALDVLSRRAHREPVTQWRTAPNARDAAVQFGYAPHAELYVVSTVDPHAAARRIIAPDGMIDGFDWLPDSSGLLVATLGGGDVLWHVPADATQAARALGAFHMTRPRIGAQSSRAVFEHNAGHQALFRMRFADAATELQRVRALASSFDEYFPAVSPNAQSLVFVSNRNGRPVLYRTDLDHQRAVPIFEEAVDAIGQPAWSADGQWLAFFIRVGARWSLRQMRIDANAIQRVEGDWDAAHHVAFTDDGHWLYFDVRVDDRWQIMRRALFAPASASTPVAFVTLDATTPMRVPGSPRLLVVSRAQSRLAWLDADGEIQSVPGGCGATGPRHAWAATQSALYCVLGDVREEFALYRQVWTGTGLERIAAVPPGLPLLGLSVSERDDFAVLGKRFTGVEADIKSVDLTPTD